MVGGRSPFPRYCGSGWASKAPDRLSPRKLARASCCVPGSRFPWKFTAKSGWLNLPAITTRRWLLSGFPAGVRGAHPRTAPVFSLASPKGGEGRGEEAQGFTAQIPSPQPSPRSGGGRETGQCQDAPPALLKKKLAEPRPARFCHPPFATRKKSPAGTYEPSGMIFLG